jgi:hypothetical protein
MDLKQFKLEMIAFLSVIEQRVNEYQTESQRERKIPRYLFNLFLVHMNDISKRQYIQDLFNAYLNDGIKGFRKEITESKNIVYGIQ